MQDYLSTKTASVSVNSLLDRIAIKMMRQMGIPEVLAHDHHFTQSGFVILRTD